jgi:hypothetical protein
LNKLNSESINYNFNEILPGEELIAVMFKSNDGKIDYSIPCKNTTTFVKIEEKLYDEYPELKDFNTYFTVNGRIVKRFKSMLENNIRNHDKILLNIHE